MLNLAIKENNIWEMNESYRVVCRDSAVDVHEMYERLNEDFAITEVYLTQTRNDRLIWEQYTVSLYEAKDLRIRDGQVDIIGQAIYMVITHDMDEAETAVMKWKKKYGDEK